jgi:hypothetical protein
LTLNATGGAFALANTGVLTMPNADSVTRGLLTAADWITFNNKQNAIPDWTTGFGSGTQATSTWTATNAATNVNAAIIPKGTGAIVAAIPDGTATGGNARGQYAVDLQRVRSAATHIAGGNYSVILGGSGNFTLTNPSEVGISTYNTIVAGQNNRIYGLNGSHNFIGGGTNNNINGSHTSVICGGDSNNITFGTRWNVIAGGRSNSISGENEPNYRTIGGGFSNSGGNVGFTIAGGQSNACGSGQYSSIGGGLSNTSNGNYSRVGGGQSNTASGSHSSVGGGQTNTASNQYATIGGGNANGASSYGDTIAGGLSNSTYGSNNSFTKFIGGGESNQVGGDQTSYSGLVCGYLNAITSGRFAFIGGGRSNLANSGAWDCTIGGGQSNYANGNNQAATHATIGGGFTNTTSAFGAIVTGGSNGIASLHCQQVHASGQFSAQGDAQAHELIWRRAITGTAITELFLDGASAAAILPTTNSVWHGTIEIVAICTNAGGGTTIVGDVEAASYLTTIKRIGANTTLVGGVQQIGITNADASMSTASFTIDANNTNESLRIQFTPPATANATTQIRVVATFRGTQIKY